jgi:hypothetical protein
MQHKLFLCASMLTVLLCSVTQEAQSTLKHHTATKKRSNFQSSTKLQPPKKIAKPNQAAPTRIIIKLPKRPGNVILKPLNTKGLSEK